MNSIFTVFITKEDNTETLCTSFFSCVIVLEGVIGISVCVGKTLNASHTVLRTCCLVLADSSNPAPLFAGRCYYNGHNSSEFGKPRKLREILLCLLALA